MIKVKKVKLKDLIDVQRGHDLPISAFIEGEYPVIGSSGVIGFHNKYSIKGPGITIGRSGASAGKVNYIESDFWAHNTTIYVTKFKLDNPKFIYYLLKNINLKEFNSGSAIPTLNRNFIYDIEFDIPDDKNVRNEIVNILSSIEQKIDHSKKIIEKLESLALLLFSNFFLSNQSRFTDGSFGKIITELTKKINANEQNDYKVLSAVNTSQLIPSEDYFSKQVYSKDLSKYKTLEQFDFAYNPARVNIGSLGMLDKPIKGCVSPVYIAFRAKPHWHYFVDLMIKQPHIRKTIEVYCSGSVRQVLRFEDFCRIEIKLPPEKKVLEFNEVYQNILNKINHNKQQIEKSTALRDAILPKLMTGKIEIKN